MEKTKSQVAYEQAVGAYKLNTLALAKHHRKYCEREECNISLTLLRMMAERAGIKFEENELKEFF